MPNEAELKIGDRRIRYLDSGAGWPVVLLHGFPLMAEMWRPQFDRVPDGWRFVVPDLAGFGGSSPLQGAPTMDGYADDVLALLDHLRIDSATIGGLSMGGYITFALLRKAPERFTAAVLANTRAQADSAEGREARKKMRQLVAERGVPAVADQMLPKLLADRSRQQRPALERQLREMIEMNGVQGVGDAIDAMMQRPDSTPLLARIGRPALIVTSVDDALIPVADSETMHNQIRRSRLVVLEGAGHISNLEAPEEFSSALNDFLASNL